MCEVASHREADLVVVNSCTVTHRSDQQVRQAVRRVHRENPGARIVVTGCYAERDPETLAAIPGVSLVVGNADKERLPQLLAGLEAPGQQKIVREPLDQERDYLVPAMARTGGKTRPLVKLQDGCDARCSYCIVPQVRGPGRSARAEDVLSEIAELAAAGFSEIVLTGIHLGTYRSRTAGGYERLSGLLRRIAEIPGLGRIRLSSIEPMNFEREIVHIAAQNAVFARHFHIPMQSGSDRVLKKMRRPYQARRVRALFEFVQKQIPDVGLGTDVLVGFPEESEEDFSETCRLISDSPLTYLHVFPFSPREGTEAWSMPGRVPSAVVKERLAQLLEISRSKNLEFRRRFLGRALPAITLAKEEDLGSSVVLTDNYIHVKAPGHSLAPNRLVDIRIEDVTPSSTIGRI